MPYLNRPVKSGLIGAKGGKAMQHIRHLAETIGPRGSTTPEEEEAARYVEFQLRSQGLSPMVERFTSPRSVWAPFGIIFVLALDAAVLARMGRIGSLMGGLLALYAAWLYWAEFNFRETLLGRIVPRGQSQNVLVRVPPEKERKSVVVISAHLDTHRTSLLFRNLPLLVFFRIMVPANLVLFTGCGLLFLYRFLALSLDWAPLLLFVLSALGILFAFQAELSPYTPGANDNASGVEVALRLAGKLARSPLPHTEVVFLFTGCEEVGCYGMRAFLEKHGSEYKDAVFIVLDSVGIGEVNYSLGEGMLGSYRTPPELVGLARKAAAEHPQLKTRARRLPGGYTESGPALRKGYKAITIVALTPAGLLPYWHHPEDTPDKIDPSTLDSTLAFVEAMLRSL